jgi:hypothetical protein
MSNENLEKAGFYVKTAEPRITGPLPQYRLFRNQALGPGERSQVPNKASPWGID